MNRDALLAAEKTPFAYGRTVRFQDIDAAGIIFFARYFEYFHDAYAEFLADTEAALPAALRAKAWAAPLVHAEADFLKPLRFGDPIEVELAEAELAEKRAVVRYRVWRGDEVVAIGETVHVSIDPKAFVATPLDPAYRRALERITAK